MLLFSSFNRQSTSNHVAHKHAQRTPKYMCVRTYIFLFRNKHFLVDWLATACKTRVWITAGKQTSFIIRTESTSWSISHPNQWRSRDPSSWGVELDTVQQTVSGLRIRGTLPPVPHITASQSGSARYLIYCVTIRKFFFSRKKLRIKLDMFVRLYVFALWILNCWNGELLICRLVSLLNKYSFCGGWMNEFGALVEWHRLGKSEVLGEKSVPVQFCAPQIPHGVTADRAKIFQFTCHRPMPWHTARPRWRDILVKLKSLSFKICRRPVAKHRACTGKWKASCVP